MIRYGLGKTVQEGRFDRTGLLNKPPDILLNAVESLKARHMVGEPAFSRYVAKMVSRSRDSVSPACILGLGIKHDQLFEAEDDHAAGEASCVNCYSDCLVM